jgi:hypothetical protein
MNPTDFVNFKNRQQNISLRQTCQTCCKLVSRQVFEEGTIRAIIKRRAERHEPAKDCGEC